MKKFSASVWARQGEFAIRPIDSIEEALIFLDGWPTLERSPLYYVACNSIGAASEGSIPPDEAKEALIDFLASAGALAEERPAA